ncbi:DnaJ C-terminal domain-containing protein [Oryzifoliimicrobium ureilyticus]|uniref:DnaJ C-terminal domain-containing protein n=1 Tax=Oryzifoliimicrobium ureilyticus TaxID=3113724 RepID=UPI0030762BDC
MRDPYKVLGIRRDANQAEIKAAWRSLAKSAHPDHNPGDPDANARFMEIGRAYELLKDPKKRRQVDRAAAMAEPKSDEPTIMQQRQAAREAAERAKAARENAERIMEELARAAAQKAAAEAAKQQTGTVEAEEVVERMFGFSGRATSGSRARPSSAGRPAGPEAETASAAAPEEKPSADDNAPASDQAAPPPSVLQPLTLLTSLVRRITGAAPLPEKAPDELAIATVTIQEIMEQARVSVPLHDNREATLTLSPGMTEGSEIRLKGQGYKLPGMARGDAVVTLKVAPDADMTVRGYDVHTILPVSIDNAVLGMQAEVRGPTDSLKIDIPAWSGSDKVIRIPGKGLPNEASERGDLVVELRIVLWEKPDDKMTDLMRSMKNGLYL